MIARTAKRSWKDWKRSTRYQFRIFINNDNSKKLDYFLYQNVKIKMVKPCSNNMLKCYRFDLQEADALDITFVKVNDHRYAKKYGVNKLPSLVYFRRKFPSIYRGTNGMLYTYVYGCLRWVISYLSSNMSSLICLL